LSKTSHKSIVIENLCKNNVGQKYYNLELSFSFFPDIVGLELTFTIYFILKYQKNKRLCNRFVIIDSI